MQHGALAGEETGALGGLRLQPCGLSWGRRQGGRGGATWDSCGWRLAAAATAEAAVAAVTGEPVGRGARCGSGVGERWRRALNCGAGVGRRERLGVLKDAVMGGWAV